MLQRVTDACGLALADAVNTVARATAVDLLGAIDGAATHVIHNGVAPPDTAGTEAEPVALFYAGLASHRKRLLEEFRQLSRQGVALGLSTDQLHELLTEAIDQLQALETTAAEESK